MAILTYIETSNALDSISKVSGQIIHTTSDSLFHYDNPDGNRVLLDCVVLLDTDTDRTTIDKYNYKLYIVKDAKTFYVYNQNYDGEGWREIKESYEIPAELALHEGLIPMTIRDTSGKGYAPRTLMTAVYSDDGRPLSEIAQYKTASTEDRGLVRLYDGYDQTYLDRAPTVNGVNKLYSAVNDEILKQGTDFDVKLGDLETTLANTLSKEITNEVNIAKSDIAIYINNLINTNGSGGLITIPPEKDTIGGTGNLAGNGNEVTIPHGLDKAPISVMISTCSTAAGDVWVRWDATNIYVGNTGTSTEAFAWIAKPDDGDNTSFIGGVATLTGSGNEISFAHGLTKAPTGIMAIAHANTSGNLGALWTRYDDTKIYIGSNGTYTGEVSWIAQLNNTTNMKTGVSNYSGNNNKTIIKHGLSQKPFFVYVDSLINPASNIGTLSVTYDETNIYVQNAGSFVDKLTWIAHANSTDFISGIASYSGNGRETMIKHNMQVKPTAVLSVPMNNTNGDLGATWARVDDLNIYVGNTGDYQGQFIWIAKVNTNKSNIVTGDSTFVGSGNEVTIPHTLGSSIISMHIDVLNDINAAVGDCWIRWDATNIYVGNTGDASINFTWVAQIKNTDHTKGGVANFTGNSAETKIAHGFTKVPAAVSICANEATNGTLGDIWAKMDETYIYIGNTGDYTGKVSWIATMQ